jgi:hypothetical protein
MMSDAASARAVAPSKPIAAQRPPGPMVASKCPGSGLAAAVWSRVRPSGNSTVFWTSAPGANTAAGAVATATAIAVLAVMAANLTAARPPCLTASVAARIGSAGQAVALMAQATPSAIAATGWSPGRRGCAAVPARARLSSASTGRSVSPVVSGSASTGEPKASAARRNAPRGRAMRNAAARTIAVVMPSQSLGLPAAPCSPAAAGNPKIVMAGWYGSYCRACEMWSADRYGVPCCSSRAADRATTVSELSPALGIRAPSAAWQASGAAIAPASAMISAASRPRRQLAAAASAYPAAADNPQIRWTGCPDIAVTSTANAANAAYQAAAGRPPATSGVSTGPPAAGARRRSGGQNESCPRPTRRPASRGG